MKPRLRDYLTDAIALACIAIAALSLMFYELPGGPIQ